jgi:hypothetical protein
MTIFVLQQATSRGTLRSAGITPLLRYGLAAFIRFPSLNRRPLMLLLLRCRIILRSSVFGIDVFAKTFSGYSPGCSKFFSFNSMQSETPGV